MKPLADGTVVAAFVNFDKANPVTFDATLSLLGAFELPKKSGALVAVAVGGEDPEEFAQASCVHGTFLPFFIIIGSLL